MDLTFPIAVCATFFVSLLVLLYVIHQRLQARMLHAHALTACCRQRMWHAARQSRSMKTLKLQLEMSRRALKMVARAVHSNSLPLSGAF